MINLVTWKDQLAQKPVLNQFYLGDQPGNLERSAGTEKQRFADGEQKVCKIFLSGFQKNRTIYGVRVQAYQNCLGKTFH